jgi:hypothetical protein
MATSVVVYRKALEVQQCADSGLMPVMTPWRSIGGCGAGGGGGGGGGSPKWVGMGVSGGVVDVEMMYTARVGQTSHVRTINTRFSTRPHWKYTVGLSVPFNQKFSQVQYLTNLPPSDFITGGLGDISLDVARSFGSMGQYSMSLGLTVPTGQYDIRRGTDNASLYLPSNLQNGSGLYNLAVGLSTSRDVEDGLWLFDIGYSHPFSLNFTGENRYLDNYDPALIADKADKRFYYTFKPYGETDMGDVAPPGLSASAFYGYRKIPGRVHSWGISFSAPLAQAWMRDEDPFSYNPEPDPDHQAWSGALHYGIEASRREFPFFFSVIKPIHEKPDAQHDGWNAPDWKDFIHSWVLAAGVKASAF